MDGLIALLLFGVFAACLLVVLLTGAGAYRRLTERDDSVYEERTCAWYIAARVRQAQNPAGIRAEKFGDGDALRIADGFGFATWVYCCDGFLMELYADENASMDPQDGEKVMELGGLRVTLEDGLLRVTLSDRRGKESEILLAPGAGKRAAG